LIYNYKVYLTVIKTGKVNMIRGF